MEQTSSLLVVSIDGLIPPTPKSPAAAASSRVPKGESGGGLFRERKEPKANVIAIRTCRRGRRTGHIWRVRLPNSERDAHAGPVMVRTAISAAAYHAVAASSMRLLLEQRGPQGGYFLWLDQVTLKQLKATKRRSEALSDVIIRLAKVDAKERG
jgi:hypothetical protein